MAKSPSNGVAARMRYDHGLRATLATVAIVAGLASGQALAADAQVKIANFTFDPPILTVKAGTGGGVTATAYACGSTCRSCPSSSVAASARSFSLIIRTSV